MAGTDDTIFRGTFLHGMYDGYDPVYRHDDAAVNLEIKPDADGEERVLLVDVVLELDMKLYQEETETILLDVYTPKLECIPQREPQMLEQLVVKMRQNAVSVTGSPLPRHRERFCRSVTERAV